MPAQSGWIYTIATVAAFATVALMVLFASPNLQ
jgi:hypothetical protein